jgi:hypothetical protein
MPVTGKLTALKVAREKQPGLYGDGGGLYLQISARGSKSWIFRFWIAERDPMTGNLVRDPATKKVRGRSREMGLGSFSTVSLAEARERSAECRKLREQEIDPIEAREAARQQAALERARSLKFKEAAATYMATHRVAWKNDKHAAQWTSTLETYAYPLLGELSIQAVDTTLVMKVIARIGIYDSDRRTNRRSDWRAPVRIQHARKALDRSCTTHESGQGAPRTAAGSRT